MSNKLLFDPSFAKIYLGLDRLNQEMSIFPSESNYPPYNIVQTDEYHDTIELAVAGFEPEEISVTTQNRVLKISGSKKASSNEVEPNYRWHGLAYRDFVRSFKLHDYTVVNSAEFHNGILSIVLEYRIPDELKPQSIKIERK